MCEDSRPAARCSLLAVGRACVGDGSGGNGGAYGGRGRTVVVAAARVGEDSGRRSFKMR